MLQLQRQPRSAVCCRHPPREAPTLYEYSVRYDSDIHQLSHTPRIAKSSPVRCNVLECRHLRKDKASRSSTGGRLDCVGDGGAGDAFPPLYRFPVGEFKSRHRDREPTRKLGATSLWESAIGKVPSTGAGPAAPLPPPPIVPYSTYSIRYGICVLCHVPRDSVICLGIQGEVGARCGQKKWSRMESVMESDGVGWSWTELDGAEWSWMEQGNGAIGRVLNGAKKIHGEEGPDRAKGRYRQAPPAMQGEGE